MITPVGSQYTKNHLELAIKLIDRLAALPAEVTTFDYSYEAFGSWFVVLRRNGIRHRLVFDGRDDIFLVQRLGRPNQQEQTPDVIAEQKLAGGLTPETLELVIVATTQATARGLPFVRRRLTPRCSGPNPGVRPGLVR